MECVISLNTASHIISPFRCSTYVFCRAALYLLNLLSIKLILYHYLLYSTLLSSTLLYSTLLYSTQLYSTLLYSTLLYSTLLKSTLLGNWYSRNMKWTVLNFNCEFPLSSYLPSHPPSLPPSHSIQNFDLLRCPSP